MPAAVPNSLQIRSLVALLAAASVFAVCGAGVARAAGAGTLPPHNPVANCAPAAAASGQPGLAVINLCRASEGVGPLRLPSNWGLLTPVEQGFVLINLERVNRGLVPIVGLSPVLDQLASQGAAAGSDPSFPAGGFTGGGAIWAGASSIIAADYMWMYDDGPGASGSNLACPSAGAPGCWGHRDIILWKGTGGPLVAGGGYATSGAGASFAYVVLAGYPAAGLSFTWAQELRYFSRRPQAELAARAVSARARRRLLARRRHGAPAVTQRHGSQGKPAQPAPGSGLTITFG